MSNAKRFWVIMGVDNGTPWPLDIDASTMEECKRAILWQHTGSNYEKMHICHFDRAKDALVTDSYMPRNGNSFINIVRQEFPFSHMTRLPYKESAFARFRENLLASA